MSPIRLCDICQQHHSQQGPELQNKSPTSTSPLKPPKSTRGAACQAASCVEMDDLTPVLTPTSINTLAESPLDSGSSGSSTRGRARRRADSHSSGYTPSPDTPATEFSTSSTDIPHEKKDMPSESLVPPHLPNKSTPIPDEYLLSVRARHGFFFPTQVSSTLLWNRSAWFRTRMSKPSPSGNSTTSSTGLKSFYATDSSKGRIITLPFTTTEGLELYLNLLLTGTVMIPSHLLVNDQYTSSTMTDLVDLYLLSSVHLQDPIAAQIALEEISKQLFRFFTDDGTLDELTTSIWEISLREEEGNRYTAVELLRQEFREWGLRVCEVSWLEGVSLWMEEEEKGLEDLLATDLTAFERDVVRGYRMDRE